jgi:hypothetical protein
MIICIECLKIQMVNIVLNGLLIHLRLVVDGSHPIFTRRLFLDELDIRGRR